MLELPSEKATPGWSVDLRVAGSEVMGAGESAAGGRCPAVQGAYPTRASKDASFHEPRCELPISQPSFMNWL